MLLRVQFALTLLACLLLLGLAHESEKKKTDEKGMKKDQKGRDRGKDKTGKELTNTKTGKVAGSKKKGAEPRNDLGCTSIGGICQRDTYVCQGRYLKDKCAGAKTRQCCMPAAWNVLCASHHHNRVRGCDKFGCGAFNSIRNGGLRRAVDIVCDDYAIVNAPFSGTLVGPIGRKGGDGIQYDGVKISNSVHCVRIFNIRPYRYVGAITQGEALGYLLPLQERFSGITSHLKLQMCDLSDPSPFI